MSLTLARYKDMLGYLIHIPNSPKVGFKTNTGFYRVFEKDLDTGEHIIPIPFYKNSEVYIIRQNANSTFTGELISGLRLVKRKRLSIGFREITWFLVDSTTWKSEMRSRVKNKYGLTNFEYISFSRTIN